MDPNYKARKEAFVSGLAGGSILEVNAVTLVASVSATLWLFLDSFPRLTESSRSIRHPFSFGQFYNLACPFSLRTAPPPWSLISCSMYWLSCSQPLYTLPRLFFSISF
jgi:hypothetical protein